MAYFQLTSLLNGPIVQVLLDEKRDGCFGLICHDQPLLMLTYFSSTIREEFPASHPMLSGGYCSSPWPSYTNQPPLAVRLIGGSATAVKDLIEWMAACCQQNTLVSLRSVVSCPARYILAMDGVQRLGVEVLGEEVSQLLVRLRYELFDVETAQEIFAAGNNLLPELADAMCHCVARYFFHGSLPEVEKWMYLASMNLKFDDGVKAWLSSSALNEGPDTIDALGLWNSKSPLTYPARWHRPACSFPRAERHRPPPSRHPCDPQPAQYHAPHCCTPPAAPSSPTRPQPPPRYPSSSHRRPDTSWGDSMHAPPPPPPKPAAYCGEYHEYTDHHQNDLRRPTYTKRCGYCQEIYPDATGASHQCTTGHAYTISSTPSPPPRRRSRSRCRRHHNIERTPSPQRERSQREYIHNNHNWDASYESLRPGEYLRERRQLGPDHFVYFFVDQYGRERVVTKGGDMSVEGTPW